MKKLTALLLTVLLLVSAFTPVSASPDTGISALIDDIVNAKMQALDAGNIQELVDRLAEKPAAGNEWWILAIRNRYENLDYSLYRETLENYVKETPPSVATSKERIALTLAALNSDSAFPAEIIDEAIDTNIINAYIFGLHLINNGVSAKYSSDDLLDRILALQCEDGGWSLKGTDGDTDITAMVLQAVAPYKNVPGMGTVIDNALAFLSQKQLDDGSYSSYNSINPETSGQILVALSALDIDAETDERFIKNGNSLIDGIEKFKRSSGTYAHTSQGQENETSQTQIFYSYVAYEMYKHSEGPFYVFSPLTETLIERTTETSASKGLNIKTILYIVIAAATAVLCLVRLLQKERKAKAYISIILIGAVLAAGVSFINIKSKDEYYKKEDAENPIFTTISIYCNTVAGKEDYIPKNGIILEYNTIQVSAEATIYDQLIAACKEYGIQMENETDSYIVGLANIYENQFGDLSGWMFKLNGEFSDTGSNQKKLKDGDYVEWVYTTNLGKDVGNDYEGK